MSPVNDAYKKANLASGEHRVAMAQLAAQQLPYVMADGWEAEQPKYQRTVPVLRHFSEGLAAHYGHQPGKCAAPSSAHLHL